MHRLLSICCIFETQFLVIRIFVANESILAKFIPFDKHWFDIAKWLKLWAQYFFCPLIWNVFNVKIIALVISFRSLYILILIFLRVFVIGIVSQCNHFIRFYLELGINSGLGWWRILKSQITKPFRSMVCVEAQFEADYFTKFFENSMQFLLFHFFGNVLNKDLAFCGSLFCALSNLFFKS